MKKTLLLLVGLITALTTSAQTLIFGGQVTGSGLTNASVTKIVNDYNGNIYVAGTFSDSVDLDINGTLGGYTLTGPVGSDRSFVAKYAPDGEVQWGFALGGATSTITIKDIITDDYYGRLFICGSFTGLANFGTFGPAYYLTALTGSEGYFASYDLFTGNVNLVSPLVNTGTYCSVNGLDINTSGDLLVTGSFDGLLDIDTDTSSLAVTYIGALSGRDAFIGKYSYSDLSDLYTRVLAGSGDEEGLYIKDDESGGALVTGTFSNNIDLDWDVPVASRTTNGSTDVFYTHYSSSFDYIEGMSIGSTLADAPRGLLFDWFTGEFALAVDFYNTIDMNPLATPSVLTSAGNTDVAVARYQLNGQLNSVVRLGDAGPNQAFFLVEAPQSFGGERSAVSSFYVALSHTNPLDVDPGAAVETVPGSGTAIVEFGSVLDKISHISIEAPTCHGMCFNPYNVNDIVLGGFSDATGPVDIMPYTPVFNISEPDGGSAGYLIAFNECQMTVNIEMPVAYECGTCTATLVANVQNGIGGISYVSWYPSGPYGELVNSNLCPDVYSVDVTDGHGCYPVINPLPFTIPEHGAGAELDATVAAVPTSCGNNYGSAAVTVTNAVGAYTVQWSNGDTTTVADSLYAGIYNVYITDSLNCYIAETFNIDNNDGPSITVNTTTDPSCADGTGSVDVTVTGGLAPYTFLWSNGLTTEDLTGATEGTYALVVTDANNCTSQVCVNINAPEEVLISVTSVLPSTCLAAGGSLAVDVTGGTAPYTYLWNDPAASTTDSISGLSAGTYTVQVTDANGCVFTNSFGVSDAGGPYKYWSYSEPASCTYGPGNIIIDLYAAWPYTTQWSHGETGQYALNIPEAGKYILTVTDAYGCKGVFEETVGQYLPNSPELCMVTVDSTGTQNVVVWDKTVSPEAEYFKVYREGFCASAGFLPIGTVNADSLSLFYDTVVNTETKSWKYYVTAVDSCGFESYPSTVNKTIHLVSAFTPTGEIQLNWDAYVGRDIALYRIFRVDPLDPALYTLIDSVGAYTLSYLDDDNFLPYDGTDIEYYVEAVPLYTCYASKAFNQNASRSNHSRLSYSAPTTLGITSMPADDIRIYPNPANDRLNINVNGSSPYTGALLNHVGQVLGSFEVNRSVSISTASLPQGVYFVRMSNASGQQKTFKLIIAH